jgi:Ribosomal RNA adenine dimethylase
MKTIDKSKVDAFWAARTNIKDPRVATNYRDDGRLGYDVDFVRRYLPEEANILDLGAGTCTLSVELLDRARRIVAVEKQSAFLEKAPDHPRLIKLCSDIGLFNSQERFDAVLMFGIVNFLTLEEEKAVYKSCLRYIGDGGVLLVKHQCGANESFMVDSYSAELKSDYHARYPSVTEQTALLSEFFNVEPLDIYPTRLNRWPNSHFFAFICRPPRASEGRSSE